MVRSQAPKFQHAETEELSATPDALTSAFKAKCSCRQGLPKTTLGFEVTKEKKV